MNDSRDNTSLSPGNGSTQLADDMFYFYFYKITVPTLFGLIICVGLVGNCLVACVIIFKPKMQTRINILILNLSISDLLFLVICVPFVTYHFAADNWLIGEVICKLSQYLIYVTMYVTMYTLVAISVVRYILVVHSHTSRMCNTKLSIAAIVCCIWAVNIISHVYMWIYYEVNEYNAPGLDPYYFCGMDDVKVGRHIFISFFLLSYVLPLFLITYFYVLLLNHLSVTRRHSLANTSDHNGSRRQKKSTNVSRTVVAVVIVLAICWLPLHIHFLISYFGYLPKGWTYEIFRVLCHCLAYSNACMNPIIYNFVSADFRKHFKEILSCK